MREVIAWLRRPSQYGFKVMNEINSKTSLIILGQRARDPSFKAGNKKFESFESKRPWIPTIKFSHFLHDHEELKVLVRQPLAHAHFDPADAKNFKPPGPASRTATVLRARLMAASRERDDDDDDDATN